MPQAPEFLRQLFDSDAEALDTLAENFIVLRNGIIHRKNKNHVPTQDENNAIAYLILEWDYGYESGKTSS